MRSTHSSTVRIVRWLLPLATLMTSSVTAEPSPAQEPGLGFQERFALAEDRYALLAELIPGTPDFYYYSCLEAQHRQAFDEVPDLIDTWRQRHKNDVRINEIENRQALLTFDSDPTETYRHLQQRLGLSFNHQRTLGGPRTELPGRLDPARVAAEAFAAEARRRYPDGFGGFQSHALESLATSRMNARQLRDYLERLPRPDVANLPALVVRDLENPRSDGFGSIRIHSRMLLDQLEQCAQALPRLLGSRAFLDAYLTRLQPGPDVDLELDAAARLDHLERLEAFSRRLTPAHNSLKAHVIHHRLQYDLERGEFDRGRLLEYLRLPREASWANRRYQRRLSREAERVQLGQAFTTGLPPIQGDEALVRAHLEHWFASQDTIAGFDEFIETDYLKRVLAEARILAGDPDTERWYSLLDDPRYYEALQARVELDFVPGNRTHFRAEDPVGLTLDVKNVRTLIVKVFEINALNYYRAEGHELTPDINLDGLIAGEEVTHSYDEPALRRVRREYDFPSMRRPGTYVVEFIGNGLSSRAIVHKGRLGFVQRHGSAGHVFQVLDEDGKPLSSARLHLGGREFSSDDLGEILIPYTTSPGRKPILLEAEGLATLEQFQHLAENYSLAAGFLIDRETLLAGEVADLALRPSLQLNGQPIGLDLLDSPSLTITTKDLDGITSTLVLRDLELSAQADSLHEFRVPDRLVSLTAHLTGRIRNLSEGEWVDLRTSSQTYSLNGIDSGPRTETLLLGRTPSGFVLDLLGKNGEPRASRALQLEFTHEDFTVDIDATLGTDASGRVELGGLPGILSVVARTEDGEASSWSLDEDHVPVPSRLHGVAGRTLRVPLLDTTGTPRELASLFELRGGAFALDRADRMRVRDGFLELEGLPAGDHQLWLKRTRDWVDVRVTPEVGPAGWVRSGTRMLELERSTPLHVVEAAVVGEELVLRLAGAGPDTRVHVTADRYLSPYDLVGGLSVPGGPQPQVNDVRTARSSYHAGREIGDEYRYILERRLAAKFPGNMLRRPGLLLNPWALDEFNTAIGVGGGAGGRFGGRAGGRDSRRSGGAPASKRPGETASGAQPNLDFLPSPSSPAFNLKPAEDGTLRVPLAALGQGQLLHVLAVDRESTVHRTVVRDEIPLEPRDRRLAAAFDAAAPLSEQRSIEFVSAGSALVIADMSTSVLEVYDSLDEVHTLFASISNDSNLETFSFLLRWPELSAQERAALYSQHACHELHVFLHQKDRAYFDSVVRPYLANKSDKTFLDLWLLEEDLSAFLEPWAFQQLNVVERILLTRRIEGRGPAGARHVRELYELLPPDIAREHYGFEEALKSTSLAATRKSFAVPGAGGPSTPGPVAPSRESRARSQLEDKSQALDRAGQMQAGELAEGEPQEELEEEAVATDDFFLGRAEENDREDLERRNSVRFLYRPVGETEALVEHNYYHRRIEETGPGMIQVNGFWTDFAMAATDAPFVSANVVQATGSLAEMLLALAFLDLPFSAEEPETTYDGSRLTLRGAGPLLAVSRQLRPASPADDAQPLLVSQDLFRLDDPVTYEGNETRDKFVRDEFLIGVAYGCRVVVTNPTSSQRRLEILMQVPQGALAVNGGKLTRGRELVIEPYGTARLQYAFYFPAPGEFPHYPVQAAHDGELIASGTATTLRVVTQATTVDTSSWEHISQLGTIDEVLAYLDNANLQRLDLARIAWRMGERASFDATLALLRERHAYGGVLWSYGIRHRDERTSREYLQHANGFLRSCGPYLDSSLVSIDPVERKTYQHVEFEPLFNPRAHPWQGKRELLNSGLRNQYPALLRILAYRPTLDDEDRMSATYYLLLQDRVEEALATFTSVQPDGLETRLQYDYMRAYLDFFSDDHALARGIAEPYLDHPVERWRSRFEQVVAHLDEAEGKAPTQTGDDDLGPSQDVLASSEPALELTVEAGSVQLQHDNVETCEVSYYPMDVEFLFSTNPFVQQGSGSFAYIQPARTDRVSLAGGAASSEFELPAEFLNSNVLVEVRAGGLTRRQASYAGTLSVQALESYGQLKVADEGSKKPLSKVYVKVFARLGNGQVRFHKDGYTDLRGRFDYVALSGAGNVEIDRFAVLVLSEAHGATIREIAPPAR